MQPLKFSVKNLPELNNIFVLSLSKNAIILELDFEDSDFPKICGSGGDWDGTDCVIVFDKGKKVGQIEFDTPFKNPRVMWQNRNSGCDICVYPSPDSAYLYSHNDNFQSCYESIY